MVFSLDNVSSLKRAISTSRLICDRKVVKQGYTIAPKLFNVYLDD